MLTDAAIFAIRHARVVFPALAIFALLSTTTYQTIRASKAEAQAEALAADLSAARERHARAIGSINRAIEKERQTAEDERQALDAITAAAPDADGPVSPVLADTLRRLK